MRGKCSHIMSYVQVFRCCIVYRLFFGSHLGLNIETIRIIKDKSNLKMIVQAITVLDRSVSLDAFKDFDHNCLDKKSNHGSLLVALLKSVIDDDETIQFNQYILNTFNCFRKSKEILIFNFSDWQKLDWKDKRSKLVLFDFLDGKYDSREYEQATEIEIVDEQKIEMEFNPDLLKIFPNVTEISIVFDPPRFSLSQFLSIIKNTSVKTVSMQFWKCPWQIRYSQSLQEKIINEYDMQNFDISFDDVSITIWQIL